MSQYPQSGSFGGPPQPLPPARPPKAPSNTIVVVLGLALCAVSAFVTAAQFVWLFGFSEFAPPMLVWLAITLLGGLSALGAVAVGIAGCVRRGVRKVGAMLVVLLGVVLLLASVGVILAGILIDQAEAVDPSSLGL